MTTLPGTLADFRAELERAVAHDLARPRTKRAIVRVAVVTGAAGAVGFGGVGIVGLVGRDSPTGVERAAAALALEPRMILHVAIVGRQDNGDGTTSTWRSESWQSTSPPYARRQVEQVGGEPAVETASLESGATNSVYDAARRTVYVLRQGAASGSGGPVAGKALRWKSLDGTVHRVIVNPKRPSSTGPAQPAPTEEPFRHEVLALLDSGAATEAGRVSVGGRSAVRIVAANGHATYLVDANTYDPIEFRTSGDGGGTSIRFVTYEQLKLNDALLSIEAQHPDARVNSDPSAYHAAQSRLFPRG